VLALAGKPARAQVKTSQAEAQYRASPNNGMSCAVCQLFRPPRGCAVVAGDIAPQGWCRFFALPD
jgi:hypothetical protein